MARMKVLYFFLFLTVLAFIFGGVSFAQMSGLERDKLKAEIKAAIMVEIKTDIKEETIQDLAITFYKVLG
jgi:hypothetical protein